MPKRMRDSQSPERDARGDGRREEDRYQAENRNEDRRESHDEYQRPRQDGHRDRSHNIDLQGDEDGDRRVSRRRHDSHHTDGRQRHGSRETLRQSKRERSESSERPSHHVDRGHHHHRDHDHHDRHRRHHDHHDHHDHHGHYRHGSHSHSTRTSHDSEPRAANILVPARSSRNSSHASPTPPSTTLPFSARPLHRSEMASHLPLLAHYLQVRKGLSLSSLSEREAKGRWRAFVRRWNAGELADEWYEPGMFSKAARAQAEREAGRSDITVTNRERERGGSLGDDNVRDDGGRANQVARDTRKPPVDTWGPTPPLSADSVLGGPGGMDKGFERAMVATPTTNGGDGGRSNHADHEDGPKGSDYSSQEEDEDEDEFGPALPPPPPPSKAKTAATPSLADLALRREAEAEDRAASLEALRRARRADRAEQRARLDDIVPRAEPGSRERMLEKRQARREADRAYREGARGGDGGMDELRDEDVMGGGDGAAEYKRLVAAAERRKTERELRREEERRARVAELEARLERYREREEKTVAMLRELAKSRFG